MNAFNVTMREFVDEFSELDVLTFDQRMRRILMRSTNFVDDSFVAEFVDEFVTCGGGFRLNSVRNYEKCNHHFHHNYTR